MAGQRDYPAKPGKEHIDATPEIAANLLLPAPQKHEYRRPRPGHGKPINVARKNGARRIHIEQRA